LDADPNNNANPSDRVRAHRPPNLNKSDGPTCSTVHDARPRPPDRTTSLPTAIVRFVAEELAQGRKRNAAAVLYQSISVALSATVEIGYYLSAPYLSGVLVAEPMVFQLLAIDTFLAAGLIQNLANQPMGYSGGNHRSSHLCNIIGYMERIAGRMPVEGQNTFENEQQIVNGIHSLLLKYYGVKHTGSQSDNRIRYGQAIFDHREASAILDTLLRGWLGASTSVRSFERELARTIGASDSVMTNSGSSANLLAVSTLLQAGLRNGDEVITSATTFPTTVNSIVLNGLRPVFVDSELTTLNACPGSIRRALSKRTKAVMLPHMLGIPNKMDEIMEIATSKDLFVIEDCCDALGTRYGGNCVGSFGTLGTFSFYAGHHITTGEGGAIVSNREDLLSVATSLRDWGRTAWCTECRVRIDTAADCPHRLLDLMDGTGKELPPDYDRSYVYVNVGYNLKPMELQGAMGLEQLNRLAFFIRRRKENYVRLRDLLRQHENYFAFPDPPEKADVSWFCFPILVRSDAAFHRTDIVRWLEKNGIETRPVLAGNIVRQPAYKTIDYRVEGQLSNADYIMENGFFVGIHPGLGEEQLARIADVFTEFVRRL